MCQLSLTDLHFTLKNILSKDAHLQMHIFIQYKKKKRTCRFGEPSFWLVFQITNLVQKSSNNSPDFLFDGHFTHLPSIIGDVDYARIVLF